MCHYEKGLQNDIAFVFSCPGAKEKQENKPAAGQTGANLGRLFSILSLKYGQKTKWSRNDVTITNSWGKVEYKRLTGRTEASVNEVLTSGNLLRLEQEIKGIKKAIICCGDRAISAVTNLANMKKLDPLVKVIEIRHLGFQSLNQIKNDINNMPIYSVNKEKMMGNTKTRKLIGSDNTNKRLEVVAYKIMNDLA